MLESALYGNRDGSHQLLSSSISSTAPVLDTLRFLVDRPAGHIGHKVWSPYWGCCGIDEWWVLWRGEEDLLAPRKNMVNAQVVLLPSKQCGTFDNFDELLAAVGFKVLVEENPDVSDIAGAVADCLVRGKGPAIVPRLSVAPLLIRAIWPRLWPSARASFSLRTFFGTESLESSGQPDIIIVPDGHQPRWQTHRLLERSDVPICAAARWFSGQQSPRLALLLDKNRQQLPANLTVFERLERIVANLDKLHSGTGTASDALLVIRTIESEFFENGFNLPEADSAIVYESLKKLEDAPVADIRAASLTRLDSISTVKDIKTAISNWVVNHLPHQPDCDALWILEHQAGTDHQNWWLDAVHQGLAKALLEMNEMWIAAFWSWCGMNPQTLKWLEPHLSPSASTETILVASFPVAICEELYANIKRLSKIRQWEKLLAKALRVSQPLYQAVEQLHLIIPNPSIAALDILIEMQDPLDIIQIAALIDVTHITKCAITHTLKNPALLAGISTNSEGQLRLLATHLESGGKFPQALFSQEFADKVFAGILFGVHDATTVLMRSHSDLAGYALSY